MGALGPRAIKITIVYCEEDAGEEPFEVANHQIHHCPTVQLPNCPPRFLCCLLRKRPVITIGVLLQVRPVQG